MGGRIGILHMLITTLVTVKIDASNHLGHWGHDGRRSCKPMPTSMALCRGVGYSEMWLPNLLGHESVREVVQQAASWVPLLAKRCHPDTKKFLCSVFAPVCVEGLHGAIRPCRSLCQTVRDSCVPVMEAFGYPWPDILGCDIFPADNDLCISASPTPSIPTVEPSQEFKVCDACVAKFGDDKRIIKNFCKNDFAVKMKIKEMSHSGRDTRIVAEVKSKSIYRLNGVREEELRQGDLWLRDGLRCMCEEISDVRENYLMLGQRRADRLIITAVRRWQHDSRDTRRMARRMRKIRC
uniref:Secreted frizzled-related protein 2 n=1 Tax=Eptatretus burgeri TaxID=7764 RepID=A0A8C4Q4R0_EPTBU